MGLSPDSRSGREPGLRRRHRAVPALPVEGRRAARRVRGPEGLHAQRSAGEGGPHEHGAQPRGALPAARSPRRRAGVPDSGIAQAGGPPGQGAAARARAAAAAGRAVAAAEARIHRADRRVDCRTPLPRCFATKCSDRGLEFRPISTRAILRAASTTIEADAGTIAMPCGRSGCSNGGCERPGFESHNEDSAGTRRHRAVFVLLGAAAWSACARS